MTESPNNLSPAGQSRREAILRHAIADATHQRYTRIERRLGAVLMLAIVGTATLLVRHAPLTGVARLAADHRPPAENRLAVKPPTSLIQFVQTDPTIIERLSILPQPPRWTTINDDQLLASLAAAGKPAGLIEIDGKTQIVFR